MLLSAAVELMGIASFVPFATFATDPESSRSNPSFQVLLRLFPQMSNPQLLGLMGAAVLGLFVAGNVVRAVTQWACAKLAWEENERLSKELLARYMAKPFVWFLGYNTSDLARDVVEEVNNLVQNILMRFLTLVSRVFIAFFIALGILWVDPKVAVVTVTALALSYAALYTVLRQRIDDLGGRRLMCSQKHHKTVLEALSSIKEAKSLRDLRRFRQEHAECVGDMRRLMISSSVLMELPLMLAETLAVATMVCVTVYFALSSADPQQTIGKSVLYLVATIRITPLLQSIYSEMVAFRFYLPVLDRLEVEFARSLPEQASLLKPLSFERGISLREVSFSYPGSENEAVRGASLDIGKNECVAFVGPTGGGKTSLADLISGVLEPTCGKLLVDGECLNPSISAAWRERVGYVPQEIYLCDDSVLRNIALGVPADEIDRVRVETVARTAKIHDFIVNDLERGYDTVLGERGINLSGGQRQRIGIARALYADPEVLIFDEATSALDNQTERAIMETIEKLGRQKTVILVAHRLSTVKNCDRIFVIRDGSVVGRGTYEELAAGCPDFQALLPHQSMSQGASLDK